MKTLVIRDNTGRIVFSYEGENVRETDFTSLVTTIPEGKQLVSINIETNEPIFGDIPKTETEILHEEIENTRLALAEFAEIMLGGTV